MIELWVRGIGLLGPGLADWNSGMAALRTPASAWQRCATVVPAAARLPANERRRAGTVIKAALAVADQAVAMADADPAQLTTVFASSTGDPANCHALCEALAAPERAVSPTRFTNSVHNAPGGYWHIATQSRRASTSIAAYDASFGAGLLEAAVCAHTRGEEVLLVACDVPYPEPLHALRPLADTMAVALVLAPRALPGRSHLRGIRAGDRAGDRASDRALCIEVLGAPAPATPCSDTALEVLRNEIPAARALPLLCALAGGGAAAPLRLEAADGCTLSITVEAR